MVTETVDSPIKLSIVHCVTAKFLAIAELDCQQPNEPVDNSANTQCINCH